ncbi:MAG: phosphate/phosphite/phosphonate ABC transporter substrate-binding protein, partial [Burkholderiales bacterium]|nr:phosphate/phosphite/phosphonate ABC transporter substrate-binding protein [Burkholderiales bacterium]
MKLAYVLRVFVATSTWAITSCAMAQTSSAWTTASPQTAKPADRYTLGVSEGTSGGIDTAVAIDKYRPLATVMEKALGKPIVISFVRNFETLEAGMK